MSRPQISSKNYRESAHQGWCWYGGSRWRNWQRGRRWRVCFPFQSRKSTKGHDYHWSEALWWDVLLPWKPFHCYSQHVLLCASRVSRARDYKTCNISWVHRPFGLQWESKIQQRRESKWYAARSSAWGTNVPLPSELPGSIKEDSKSWPRHEALSRAHTEQLLDAPWTSNCSDVCLSISAKPRF